MLNLRIWIVGVKSLLLHPLRSLLTVLGIFIGVASVIWLLAIGQGISKEGAASNRGIWEPTTSSCGRSSHPAKSWPVIADRSPTACLRTDYDRIMETIPTIKSALPIRELRRQFRHGRQLLDGRLVGCTPGYAEVTRLKIERGRFLSDVDVAQQANHCVIAADVAQRLFGYKNPMGRKIHVDDDQQYYVVVGVTESRMPTAAIGGSLDAQDFSRDVYIPITTLRGRIGDFVITSRSGSFEGEIVELNQITLRVDGIDQVLPTAELVEETLSDHSRLRDVAVIVPLELLEQARTTRIMFMIFMGFIAAISLLVGGIGIMNIMLATVTERTREIGIRRALGARRRDILRQFLVESIVLAIVGAVTGILGGALLLPATDQARQLLLAYAPEMVSNLPDVIRTVRPVLVPWSMPLSVGIALVVGVAFGVYPAVQAARLDPIEALRHE